jgi:hypothetical protein
VDFAPLVETLHVRDKDRIGLVSPLRMNWAQRELVDVVNRQYNERKPVRLIVLKARQLGISTISEALMFWWSFVHEQSHGLVIAHENDASEHLLGMTKLYWERWPYRPLFTPQYVSRKEMAWLETGSSLRIATAGGKGAGRSRTLSHLHASEVGFWEKPDEIMLGLRQTVPQQPGTLIILESTANGVGNWFHTTWEEAFSGGASSEYTPLFFPWWRHPGYCASATNLRVERLTNLTDEERALRKLGVDDDHLIWRRWAITNLAGSNEERFMQEYPATPEEAFIASGTNVFPIDRLKRVFEPERGVRGYLRRVGETVEFVPDSSGSVTIFRGPSPDPAWGNYFIGGDPTRTTRGDNACAQVINSVTYEQVAVFHGKVDPMTFAEELAKLGAYYNYATVATEIEGPGYATVGRLVELDYPNLWRTRWADRAPGKIGETIGWSTTHKRKEWAVGWLIKLIVDEDLTLHHSLTFEEMMSFTTLDNGGYGPADEQNGHDDTVMALAIACLCNSTEGPRRAYVQAEEDRMNAVHHPDERDRSLVWEQFDAQGNEIGY